MSRDVRSPLIALLAVCGLFLTGVVLSLYLRSDAGPRATLAAGERRAKSIAVLPFTTRAAAGDEAALVYSNSLHEGILRRISQLESVRVIARTSAVRFRETALDARAIGAMFGVATVLEGRVHARDGRVGVTVWLTDAATNIPLWTVEYDEPLTTAGIPPITEELARRAVESMLVDVTPARMARIAGQSIDNAAAFDLYSRGRYHWGLRTREGFETSLDLFRQAAELDSSFALAYAGIAETYHYLAGYTFLPRGEALPQSRAAAERALELDESLAEAHTLLGISQAANRDWKIAERSFQRAIRLSPSHAPAHRWYSALLSQTGRQDEALDEIRRAHDLDPLSGAINAELSAALRNNRQYLEALLLADRTVERSPNFAPAHLEMMLALVQLGQLDAGLRSARRAAEAAPSTDAAVPLVHYLQGEYDLALEELGGLIARRPDDPRALRVLTCVQSMAGRYEDAIAASERLTSLDPQNLFAPLVSARVYAMAGHEAEAREIIGEIESIRDDPAWPLALPDLAAAYAALGDLDGAFELLDEAVAAKTEGWGLRVSPTFMQLRADPRFEALLERVGLDDSSADSIMVRYGAEAG